MKTHIAVIRFLAVGLLCALITGCLFKPVAVTTRQFVLSPIPATGQTGDHSKLAVGIGPIKMPDYLLRTSLAVRKGNNEIEYLENALWAERLDRSFQHTLAANLAAQLPGSRIRLSAWLSSEVTLAAFVSVDRLEVDAQGNGTLTARWQIESPDRRNVLKSGESRLTKSGPAPYADPATIATTLSDLTAQFSEVLAQAASECAPMGPTR